MTTGRNVIPFVAAGQQLAKILELKRGFIESGIECGDIGQARAALKQLRDFLRCLREDLNADLCDDSLEDMTPDEAQQAICVIQILEESLQTEYPELSH
jgi:hypothetical protein